MQRFFVKNIDGRLDEVHSRQLVKVLRAKIGDQFVVFSGEDFEYLCEITEVGKLVSYKVFSKVKCITESEFDVRLVVSLLKNSDKFELVLQKATELGVSSIQPVTTEFSQVKDLRRVDRLMQIIVEASEQSERCRVPSLEKVISFDEYLGSICDRKVLVCLERWGEHAGGVRALDPSTKYDVVVGPEGGFSKSEVDRIKKIKNIELLSLGKRILRAETASISALSLILCNE